MTQGYVRAYPKGSGVCMSTRTTRSDDPRLLAAHVHRGHCGEPGPGEDPPALLPYACCKRRASVASGSSCELRPPAAAPRAKLRRGIPGCDGDPVQATLELAVHCKELSHLH